jgi:hypothetical protein
MGKFWESMIETSIWSFLPRRVKLEMIRKYLKEQEAAKW